VFFCLNVTQNFIPSRPLESKEMPNKILLAERILPQTLCFDLQLKCTHIKHAWTRSSRETENVRIGILRSIFSVLSTVNNFIFIVASGHVRYAASSELIAPAYFSFNLLNIENPPTHPPCH
jgi:hypothetical protein